MDPFSLLEKLQVFDVHGRDKRGRKILRITGKLFPATLVSAETLKKFLAERVFPKLEDGPFCVVYFHTRVQRCDNFPGFSSLRSVYEFIPAAIKDNLESVYFVHPGLQARLFLATFGRFLFSGGFIEKVKYVNRLEFLWEHIRRGVLSEIPDFIHEHDDALEHRPLMDYGLEVDHRRLHDVPAIDSSASCLYSLRCNS
ncbi:hypothetical protein AMTRI_Chr09g15140 [Amborella trichopoda]|uniref:CRAL-TRIO domain-containing protein n=1 Tax=Amborella trichopoda TaxID=13333 RepID=W1NLE2_AMBTC|nr:rho GTPase-activating protein 1 [Amborella trichopoda]ERM96296.1 hypothetical protein AMTR_s00001p00179640 [Amborella trichopoda]|eukprot:XP_006828880.1 rho GTPase-activating protein 1 [Amborella trichopoda]